MTEKNTQVDETTNEPANEPANEAPTTADLAKNMKGWEMACALLVGVNKTLDQVTTERDAIIAAAAGGFRPSGSAERADLIEALLEVRKTLDFEIHRIGRTSRWAVPKLERKVL